MVKYHRIVDIPMFKKILVAVDGSDPSLHALEVAATIAKQNQAELTILTVVPPLPPMAQDDTPQISPDLEDKIYESYKKMARDQAKKLEKTHPEVKTVPIAMKGRPADKIIEASEAREVDLIVVGNRGKSGIFSWMLGSVSRKVSEACTVPVLIVKNKKFCEA
jgi:nucleotide-binding universal stress UspA family protein